MPAPSGEDALEELLTRPDDRVRNMLRSVPGDILVLGAGGKMGPSLCRLLKRTAHSIGDTRRIIAVSRFGGHVRPTLAHRAVAVSDQIETISCDLADAREVARLPDAPNIMYMAGQKFGTSDDPGGTWTMNAAVPAIVANRYRGVRTVVFSTGNVYGLTLHRNGGSRESDEPAPVGEYAWSCLARERIFTSYASRYATPCAIVRLNYAVDLRYGVLVDIAVRVQRGEPIDLSMGYVNVIWQGDANAFATAALAQCSVPPRVLNVTGAAMLRVRDVARRMGAMLGKEPVFAGTEGNAALLSDSSSARELLGEPAVTEELLMHWVADWVRSGGALLGKPTLFEVRDGRY